MAQKKSTSTRASRTTEERRLERERYDARTRLLEERVAQLMERLQARREPT